MPVFPVCDHVVALGATGNGAVPLEAVEHSDVLDEALGYLATSMFSVQQSPVDNYQLYTFKDGKLKY